MADTDLEALTARGTILDTDIAYLVDPTANLPYKVDMSALTAYLEQRGRQTNASVALQSPTGGTDTYLVGSDVTIPTNRLQAKSMYRLKFDLAKTSTAGTAALVVNLRIGTAGTTADTSRGTHTFAVQTAVADEGFVDLNVIFRTVGSGTTAVVQSHASLDHRLAVTGLTTVNTSITRQTSAGFDSTTAGLKIGCSVNTGTSTVATIALVQAELFNLA